MSKLSVAIITLNEEANIAACLESLKKVADEIIVIDSGSTDRTVELANNSGAKVVHQKFEGYVQQKNIALAGCSNDFILSLDADERLDEKAVQAILTQKEQGFQADGYQLKRTTFIGETRIRHGSWNPDKKIRLVKKELAIWEGKGVHESLSVKSTNIITLEGSILHYSYKNADELFEKTKKYAELGAGYLHSQGKGISALGVTVKAWSRFIKTYFIKLGFLDGGYGWKIGKQQYYEALWKYQALRKMNNK